MDELTKNFGKLAVSTLLVKKKSDLIHFAKSKGLNITNKMTSKDIVKLIKGQPISPKKPKKTTKKEIRQAKRKIVRKGRKKELKILKEETREIRNEIWKNVKQFTSNRITASIEISNKGRVRKTSNNGNIIINIGNLNKTTNVRTITFRIGKKKPNILVHKLVMELFGPPKPRGTNIAIEHIDGNNSNNELSNLIWEQRKVIIKKRIQPTKQKLGKSKTGRITKKHNLFVFRFVINRKNRRKSFKTKLLAETAQKEYISKINKIESGELPESSLSFL